MAKRLTDTKKWNDDWYVSLSNDYKIIWQWLLDNCDHAGICKPSIGMLNMLCKTNISEAELFKIMDGRIIKCDGFWFIPKFLKFQYKTLNVGKPAIVSVVKLLKDKNLIKIVNELFGNDFIMIVESLPNHSTMIKDKDTDKDKDIRKGGMGENQALEQKNGKDDFMCYDIEKFLQNNYTQFEAICMKTGKPKVVATDELMKCHLHLTKKQLYPLQTKAAVAWFTSWLINADDFKAKYGAPKKEKLFESEPPKKHIDEILKKYQ